MRAGFVLPATCGQAIHPSSRNPTERERARAKPPNCQRAFTQGIGFRSGGCHVSDNPPLWRKPRPYPVEPFTKPMTLYLIENQACVKKESFKINGLQNNLHSII
jgi:hypothetical protein